MAQNNPRIYLNFVVYKVKAFVLGKKRKKLSLLLMREIKLLHQQTFMATPYIRRSITRAFSSIRWEGGVSMVQGASRGIGLEFVSLFNTIISFLILCSTIFDYYHYFLF